MSRSTVHRSSRLGAWAAAGVAALLATAGFAVTAHAQSVHRTASAQRQSATAPAAADRCEGSTPRVAWLRLDPFLSYPWVPSQAMNSELRYISHVEHELDGGLAPSRSLIGTRSLAQSTPSMTVSEQPDRYVVSIHGSNLRPSDVTVDLQGQQLTVGYHQQKTIRETAGAAEPAVETSSASFRESMLLGAPVQHGRIEVTQAKDGVQFVINKVKKS